jgi:hypothetical protein
MAKQGIDADIMNWLVKAPANDPNFRAKLEQANLETLQAALKLATGKCRIALIEGQIRKLTKDAERRGVAGQVESTDDDPLQTHSPYPGEPGYREPAGEATGDTPWDGAGDAKDRLPAESLEPKRGLPTVEELIAGALDDIDSSLTILRNHGWTENDLVAALAERVNTRSKVEALDGLSGTAREERFPAKCLVGELIAAATRQLKRAMTPWNVMPEADQARILEQVRQDCEQAAKSALRVYAAESRTNFIATLEQVVFKNGVKAVLSLSRNTYAHLLADSAGQEVEIVLMENFDMYSGVGDAMKTDPDNLDIFEDA